jgi:hypothetical protein
MNAFIRDLKSVFKAYSKVTNIKGFYSAGSLDRPGVWFK